MAYVKTQWNTGDPITQEKMNHIEQGILDASSTGDTNVANINAINNNIATIQSSLITTDQKASNAQSTAETALQETQQGKDAWTQVAGAITFDPDTGEITKNLATRFTEDESNIQSVTQNANLLSQEVATARGQLIHTGNSVSASNLKAKLDDMDSQISINKGAITTSQGDYTNAKGYYNSLQARLNSIDGDTTNAGTYHEKSLASHVQDVENEISDAHTSSANNTTYSSLDGRFESDEAAISNLGTSKVNVADIVDNLNQSDTDKPLSANQGRVIKTMLGGNYTSTNTVANAISTAQTNAEANAQSYADTNKVDKTDIYNGIDHTTDDNKVLDARVGKTLADRIDLIDNPSTGTVHGLDSRLTTVESEIDAANGNGTLSDRFSAIETNISTIAGELNMTDTNGLKTIGTRVDDLDAHVATLATELGMIQSGEIVDTNTRIDAIESEIETARGTSADLDTRLDGIDSTVSGIDGRVTTIEEDLNTTTTGLKDRVTAVEGTLNTATTGVLDRLTAAEGDIDTLESDLNTASTGLKARVGALESSTSDLGTIRTAITTLQGKDTIVVPLPVSGSNFTNNIPNIVNPSTDADYLIQADDEKYYYWRKIGDNWQLISGAGGGSGTGNSNAEDYASTVLFEADITNNGPEANKDYYVLESDGIRHHYRYLYDELNDSWTKIEIGLVVDINKIKRYNIATENGTQTNTNGESEEVTFLNLYQYNYDEDNTIIDTERQPFKQIVLPKGGGGGTAAAVNKLTRFGDQIIQKITGSQVLLRVFYASYDTDSGETSAGNYTLKSGNTIIDSGVLQSGASDANLAEGYKEGVTGYYEFDVSDYCNVGSTTFTLTVDVNGVTLGKSWTVTIIDLHIETTAPDTLLISSSETYDFPYTPFGALGKTLYVIIDDDTEHPTTVSLPSTASGRPTTYTIGTQAHGAHSIEMYLKATIGGTEQRTPSIRREYIWYDESNTSTPVIMASPYNEQTITATQYSTIEIPYQVYKKGASTIDVYYYLDDSETEFDKVTLDGVNTGTLSYLATSDGNHTITIKVDDVSIEVALVIEALVGIDISPVSGAIIDFDPTSLTNSSVNRLPTWTSGATTYSLTASDNFNWSDDASGGGYKEDSDGKCFVIKAGSYVDLDYPMFAGNGSNNVLTNGAEIKVIFKTKAVRDINAVWFKNTGILYEKSVGIQLGAHSGWLKTDKATDTTVADSTEEYPAWVSGTAYAIDDIVVSKNIIYKCIKVCVNNTGIVPGSSAAASFWETVTPDDTTGIAAWATGTEYAKGDIVSYDGAYYKAKKDILNEPTTNPKDLSDNWLKMGATETEIAATNSYLYFPYSEEDKIELDININQYNAGAVNNFIMSYEDGVPSKAYAYSYGVSGDGLYHNNTIRIGSNDCDVYIYHLRIYNKSLDTDEILQNFIADGKNIDEKISRYNKNCIYWDNTQNKFFTSPSATAVLDPIKLAERMPDVKILMLETPTFTVGKKNFVGGANGPTTLRCLHAEGGKVYTSRGDADNWFFQGGFHAGQGTTSDNYGQSARNVDFLFEADGVNYPTKAKNMKGYTPGNDYVSSVLIGKEASEWVETELGSGIYHWQQTREPDSAKNEICTNWKGDACKVALTSTSVPNNYFNLKVNVASSENVNNALFQKRYNDFLVYNSPAQAAQIAKHGAAYRALGLDTTKVKVKNVMEFVPAVLFVREYDPTQDGNGNYTKHNEFNDCDWHFYALGNIGDSKKTDYTRAYDPDDMNEFTCENSDNNTNNGQFQSGVFMYQGTTYAVETDYNEWDNTTAYEQNDIVTKEGRMYQRSGADMSLGENETASWVAADWTDITPITTKTIYYAPRTNPNPMDYLYGIDPEEWNVKMTVADSDGKYHYVNRKHDTLVEEEFDGDHSFEFRYACRGDYRDGDLINETDGQDDSAQFDLNHDVMLAFYEWLVTATNEQYAAEADQWIVKNAMEFFYAYTHYYTMMDNRAKNTFWHFAKTGTHRKVSRPVAALLHVYDELDNGTYTRTSDTSITPGKDYYTEYAFDLWVYDCDTAAGIDNNGALVFPYGKEDEDYRVEGEPSSGYAFNGAGSIFWRRLKNSFASEIAEVMNSADAACFNSEDLIEEFDAFQNCFPEEIWRLDIERKYIRTFTGKSVDNSITTGKQNPRFLTSMMQGRKKYQRRQWIRDQGVYFNSKYRLTDITRNENTIEFNIITPTNASELAVQPNYNLQLTPYQDMYLNVQVGNGNYQPQVRAKAGVTYTINLAKYTSGTFQETRIYINGFNSISGIGNLAPMYPYAFTLSALNHLKVLDLGTDISGYSNANFTSLPFAETLPLPLLETLNIKNCSSLSGSIALDLANNLRTIEATGTSISGVSLPDYTNIQTLHLPSTVNTLSLYGARQLTDFTIVDSNGNVDYSSLYKLHIYDSDYSNNINWIDIALDIIEKESMQTEISLLKLSTATIGNISTLEPLNEFKTPLEAAGGTLELGGTINITGNWSEVEKTTYTTVWPNLEFDTTAGTEKTKYKVVYKYDNDGPDIATLYIEGGDIAPDLYANGTLATRPTKAQTAQESYLFGADDDLTGDYIPYSGWKLSTSSVPLSEDGTPIIRSNTIIETYFNTTPRTYYVKWYLDNAEKQLIKTSNAAVAYGEGYALEAPSVQDIHDAGYETCSVTVANGTATYSYFNGWEKLPININPSASDTSYNIHAVWVNGSATIDSMFDNANLANLTPEQLLVLSGLDATAKTNYSIVSKIGIGTRMTYTMGSDNDISATTLVSTPLRLDATTDQSRTTAIQPLKSGSDAFTLAIDYCFNADMLENISTTYSTLVSCYYSDTTAGIKSGFGLFYGHSGNFQGPRVGFGDMYNTAGQSVAVGNVNNPGLRNMIVLRHPANSNILYVYSGLANDITMPAEVQVSALTWANFNSNAYLNIGRLGSDADANDGTPNIVSNGKGTIFWAKYWPQDLGQGECKRLAIWPHEQVTFAISYLKDGATSATRASANNGTGSINLAALTSTMHGKVAQSRQMNRSSYSWIDSVNRDICNKRIARGLPLALQSILCKAQTTYTVAMQNPDNQVGGYVITQSPSITRDYARLYSVANTLATSNYTAEDTLQSPFAWLDSSNVVSYNYTTSSGWQENTSDSTRAQYLNIRFPMKAINWGTGNSRLRVFRETLDTVSSSTTIAATISQGVSTVRSGDIYIMYSNNGSKAYIYATTSEIQSLGLQAQSTTVDSRFASDTTNRGGWVAAEEYWLRSVLAASNGMNFAYVYTYGEVNTNSITNASTTGLKLCYSIVI